MSFFLDASVAFLSSTQCDNCEAEPANFACPKCQCSYYCNEVCLKRDLRHHILCTASLKRAQQIDEDNQMIDYILQRKITRPNRRECDINKYCITESEGDDSNSCAICFECIIDVATELELPCHHVFCSSCLHSYNIISPTDFSCPLCRASMNEHLYQYIYNNAMRLMRRADDMKSNESVKNHYLHVAREEYYRLCKLYETASDVIHPIAQWLAGQLNVQLLQLEEKFHECIINGEMLLQQSENDGIITGIRPLVDTLRCIGISQEMIGNNKESLITFRRIQDILVDIKDFDSIVDLKRQLYIDMCRLQYKNRQFTMAIHTGGMAIEINRHFAGVYEYIALSYKSKKKLKEAILIMEDALRYETPWDARNRSRLRTVYADLRKEYTSLDT